MKKDMKMGKEKGKTWQDKIRELMTKIKRRIKMNKKTYLYYMRIVLIILMETAVILILYLTNILKLEKEMLYWLFAATAQSMAALFAVVGMFAVFRFHNLSHALRNLYDTLKAHFATEDWKRYFGEQNPECWEDPIVIDRAKDLLKNRRDDLPDKIENNLRVSIIIIRSHERAINNVLKRAKVPLIAILITFIITIFSISLTDPISNQVAGLIVFIMTIALISFSMINLFYYLISSIIVKQTEKEEEEIESLFK